MKLRSKKVEEVLLGKLGVLNGGLPVVADLTYPLKTGGTKTIYWEGNLGLIISLVERIEALEAEVKSRKRK